MRIDLFLAPPFVRLIRSLPPKAKQKGEVPAARAGSPDSSWSRFPVEHTQGSADSVVMTTDAGGEDFSKNMDSDQNEDRHMN